MAVFHLDATQQESKPEASPVCLLYVLQTIYFLIWKTINRNEIFQISLRCSIIQMVLVANVVKY